MMITPPRSEAKDFASSDLKRMRKGSEESNLRYTQRACQIATDMVRGNFPLEIRLHSREVLVVWSILQYLGAGAHSEAYLVDAEANCLGEGHVWCVLKIPKVEARDEKDSIMKGKIATELAQHIALKKLISSTPELEEVRLARNYTLDCYDHHLEYPQILELIGQNREGFLDEGCQIQEYVIQLRNYVIEIASERYTRCLAIARIVRQVFAHFPLEVPLDFQAANMGVDSQGKLTIFDPTHPNEDSFYISIHEYVNSFATVLSAAGKGKKETAALQAKIVAIRTLVNTRLSAM